MTLKSWYYDRFVAARYDRELAEITEQFREICIDRAQLTPGQTVLDVGCGTGLNQPMLAAAVGDGGRIVAVDASAAMLDRARARAEQNGYADRVTFVHGDLRRLSELSSETVDAVVATLIFSVVPDWREVFAATFERLRPGGRYTIMDNYWPNPSFRLWLASWSFAADATRPGFEPLQNAVEDFELEYHPPDAEIQFYVAHGTKAR